MIIETVVAIDLLPQLAVDDFTVADFGVGAVAVDENVQRSMQVGETVVDRQKIIDVPLVRKEWAHDVRTSRREWRRVFCIDGHMLDGSAIEIDKAVRVWRFMDLAQIQREVGDVIGPIAIEMPAALRSRGCLVGETRPSARTCRRCGSRVH